MALNNTDQEATASGSGILKSLTSSQKSRLQNFLNRAWENNVSFSSKLATIPAGFELTVPLPDTVTAISSYAFNSVVTDYRLSSSLTNIAVDAFPKGSTFVVDEGSYAELWCGENGFGYSIEGQDNLDWLNN